VGSGVLHVSWVSDICGVTKRSLLTGEPPQGEDREGRGGDGRIEGEDKIEGGRGVGEAIRELCLNHDSSVGWSISGARRMRTLPYSQEATRNEGEER